MKKLIKVLSVISLAILLVFTTCGCNFVSSSLWKNLSSQDVNPVIQSSTDSYFSAQALSVASYDTATVTSVEDVAKVSMAATYEISCTISFQYTYTQHSYNPFGGGSKTVTEKGSESGQGTGFVINADGYMVTNAHVVNLSSTTTATYNNYNLEILSRTITATRADCNENLTLSVVAYDEDVDLALLKIDCQEGSTFNYLTFFNHCDPFDNATKGLTLNYGESVVAIGNAEGYGISVTTGVVSAPIRYFSTSASDTSIEKVIQTDAAINPGNSGGPLCNLYCAVVGVNSSKIVTDDVDNMGFAIPSYVVTDFLDAVRNGGSEDYTLVDGNYQTFSTPTAFSYYLANTRAYSSTGANVTEVK